MKKRTKKLKIGGIANQKIELPIIEIGSGSPVVGISACLHGNEPEGLFIVRELLKKLPEFAGTIKLLPGANPQALIENARVNSFDNLDLNRSFPGDPKGTITQRIANVIFEEFKNCDLVIDIHTVTNVGEFMGMELNTEKKAHVTATERFNRLLNPQAIWRAVEGAKYANALDEALLREGVLGVGVEVPRLEFIDTQMMERIVDGLIAAIATKGKAKKLPSPIPVLANAKRYFSDFGGIYIPKMEVGQRISRGNVVGRVVDLTNFSEKLIRSKWDGVLFVQSSRKVLKTGDKVYVVVDQIGEFQ